MWSPILFHKNEEYISYFSHCLSYLSFTLIQFVFVSFLPFASQSLKVTPMLLPCCQYLSQKSKGGEELKHSEAVQLLSKQAVGECTVLFGFDFITLTVSRLNS